MGDSNIIRKWRINLFDAVIIAIVLVVAWFIISYLGRSNTIAFTPGTNETVTYTIELNDMHGETAYLIQPGDALVDIVEKRQMGIVQAVQVVASTRLEKNNLTGEHLISVIPDRYNAIVTVTTDVTVTENQISVPGGFIVRVGVRVSASGPQYHATGFIIDIERGDAS